jgi:putative ABC transport system substrate-binding protein
MQPSALTITQLAALACVLWFALYAQCAVAQQSKPLPTIGILTLSAGPNETIITSLNSGLRQFGYVEGKNLRVEFRTARGHPEQLGKLAEELIALRPDVIVTGGGPQVRAAAQLTRTIPIVALFHEADPALSRLISSYRQPGGNVTGIDAREIEVVGKRLELLQELFPSQKQAAVLWDAYSRAEVERLRFESQPAGIRLHLIEMRDPYDFAAAFKTVKKMHVDAALITLGPQFYVRRAQLSQAALRAKVATIHQKEDMVRAGGLISYGASFDDTWGRAAYLVDRILKGARPSDLPLEQVSRFRVALNLKTAQALALTIPESIVVRADEIIR